MPHAHMIMPVSIKRINIYPHVTLCSKMDFYLTKGLQQITKLFSTTLKMDFHFSLTGTELWNLMVCNHPHARNGDSWLGRHGTCCEFVFMALMLSARTSCGGIPIITFSRSSGTEVQWRHCFPNLNVLQRANLTPPIMPLPGKPTCWSAMPMAIAPVKQLMGTEMCLSMSERHLFVDDNW